MSNKQHKTFHEGGFSLIEVMVAMVALAVIALGTLSYRYYAALHSRIALTQMTATRTGQLLIDDWKSTGGSATYNPADLNLDFTDSDIGSNDYGIAVDNLPMYITLAYDDVEHDDEAQITLREILVTVHWRSDYTAPSGNANEDVTMELTTYVRVDASSG